MMEGVLAAMMSMGGSFFLGAIIGYFAKKIIKILMFFASGIGAFLLYLQQQQIISINLDKLEESSTFIFTSILSSFNNVTLIGDSTVSGNTDGRRSFSWICNRSDDRITKEVIKYE